MLKSLLIATTVFVSGCAAQIEPSAEPPASKRIVPSECAAEGRAVDEIVDLIKKNGNLAPLRIIQETREKALIKCVDNLFLPEFYPVEIRESDPITSDIRIFSILEKINGDDLTFSVLQFINSRRFINILTPRDEIHVVLGEASPNGTRRKGCVTSIKGWGGTGRLMNTVSRSPCLAYLADARGAVGIEIDKIAPDLVVTIGLNGDLVLDPPPEAVKRSGKGE